MILNIWLTKALGVLLKKVNRLSDILMTVMKIGTVMNGMMMKKKAGKKRGKGL